MIGVSKTFGGSSILSSPVLRKAVTLEKSGVPAFLMPQYAERLPVASFLYDEE